MESPIKEHKYLSTIDNIKKIAYDTLFTAYITENLKKSANYLEIDSTNQEELVKQFNGGFPLPGLMYTFMYPPKKGDEVLINVGKKQKKYNDVVPIVFCFSSSKDYIKGINLNALPNLERVKFLEAFYVTYKSFFEDVELLTENNKLALNDKFISLIASSDGMKQLEFLSKYAGANFKYGFRTYSMKNIKDLRLIEYSKWNYIPHYDPKDAFKLMNQKAIHENYWKTKNI